MDPLRSKGLNPDVPQYYIRRALFKSMGYTDQDLEKPFVAISQHLERNSPRLLSSSLIVDMGLDKSVALVTDGRSRFSAKETSWIWTSPPDG
jgi:dihydroxyacid dehydratase/phosphogluconate dehydratase